MKSLSLPSKTKAEAKSMANYSWGLVNGATIYCSDGEIHLTHSDTWVKWQGDMSWTHLDIKGALSASSIPNTLSLIAVDIGSDVTSVNAAMFKDCSHLLSAILPDTVSCIMD